MSLGVAAEAEVPADQKAIDVADDLYSKAEIDALHTHLVQYETSENTEILWRLARAACDKSKNTTDKEEKKRLMFDAFKYATRALELNPDSSPCHKWYAILLDYTAEYEGTTKRIENAYVAKEHFMKARELNPQDATTIHCLGVWCFMFADMAWYQRKAASLIFATPPTSTYDEALAFFLEAETVDPGFYSKNLVSIGKTYLRLKKPRDALPYLERARDHPPTRPDDKEANTEAAQLLKGIKV